MDSEYRDLVVVGASAGGVEALRALVAGLPPDYPGAVLVVLHVPRDAPSALPQILDRSGPLPAGPAVDAEPVLPGRIYVAPADHHLLVLDGRIRLTRGPSENGHRPAVDPLFRSAARAVGRRTVGVVLSGSRDDGAAGLAAVAAHGGLTIVQDPADALHPWMPQAAMDHVTPDHVAPAAKIGGLLAEITAMELPRNTPESTDALLDAEVAVSRLQEIRPEQFSSAPAGYGCPTCGGSLFEITDLPLPRFRCRVGHAWSPESLLDEQAMALESALWAALRALEEKSALSRRMAGNQAGRSAVRFAGMAEDADTAAATLRQLIARIGSAPGDTATPGVHFNGTGT